MLRRSCTVPFSHFDLTLPTVFEHYSRLFLTSTTRLLPPSQQRWPFPSSGTAVGSVAVTSPAPEHPTTGAQSRFFPAQVPFLGFFGEEGNPVLTTFLHIYSSSFPTFTRHSFATSYGVSWMPLRQLDTGRQSSILVVALSYYSTPFLSGELFS